MDINSSQVTIITKDDASLVFEDLQGEIGFDEASKFCWENCKDPADLRNEIVRRIDLQSEPTILLEFLGYGLDQSLSKWLYKYLIHGHYLVQESGWAAAYAGLEIGVDALQDYSEEETIRLRRHGSKYLDWFFKKRNRKRGIPPTSDLSGW